MDDDDRERAQAIAQGLLSDAEFKSEFETLVQSALPDLGESVVPLYLYLVSLKNLDKPPKPPRTRFNLDIVALVLDREGWTQRKDIIHGIGQRMALESKRVMMVAMASETWALKMAPGKTRADYPDDFADSPDRIDSVMVAAKSMDQRWGYARVEAFRDDEGNYNGFGDLQLAYSFEPDGHEFGKIDMYSLDAFWHGFAIETMNKFRERDESGDA